MHNANHSKLQKMKSTRNQINLPLTVLISVIIILSSLSFQSYAQAYKESIFDFTQNDFATDIIQLQDGGFLIVGIIYSDSSSNNIFIRIDNNGDTLWTKKTPKYGSSIVEFDSCFYMVGRSENLGIIYKLNKNLTPIWSNSFEDENGTVSLSKIKKTSTQKLIYSHNIYPFDGDIPPYSYFTYSDTTGNVIWKNGWHYTINEKSELSNCNLFSTALGYDDYPYSRVINYDTLGNSVYENRIGDEFDLVGGSVISNDTAFVIISATENGPMECDYLKLFKLDANIGSIISEQVSFRTNSFRLRVNSACKGSDNEILAAGYYDTDSNNTMFIFRTNFNSDSISTSFIDKYYDLRPYKIISYENSFYLIGTNYKENGNRDIYFLTAPLDTVMTNVNELNTEKHKLVEIFPNPAKNKLFISISGPEIPVRYNLYNPNGQQILSIQPLSNEIDVSNLKPGLYIIEVELSSDKIRRKVIIE